MSDDPRDNPELIAAAIAADSRFAIVARAIAVSSDMRDNETIKMLMNAIWADAVQAMEELADTSPTNVDAVSLLLVRVKTQVYIRRWLNAVLQRGKAAEHSIAAEDQSRYEDQE